MHNLYLPLPILIPLPNTLYICTNTLHTSKLVKHDPLSTYP